MIIEKDFKFRDDIEKDTIPIEILTGAYKGVIMRYTEVSIHEQENDTAKLRFSYELIEMGDHTETKLREDRVFLTEAGLILNAMILETVGDVPDATGENYSEEPVEERSVHTQGSSIS